jgi:hypothetical protein
MRLDRGYFCVALESNLKVPIIRSHVACFFLYLNSIQITCNVIQYFHSNNVHKSNLCFSLFHCRWYYATMQNSSLLFKFFALGATFGVNPT